MDFELDSAMLILSRTPATLNSMLRDEYVLFASLLAWAKRRRPSKNKWWIMDQYWRITKGKGWRFQPPGSDYQLYRHSSTQIRRHVKVQGRRSPYDDD